MAGGDHGGGEGTEAQSHLASGACCRWAGISRPAWERGDTAFIHSSFKAAPTHPPIHTPLFTHPLC